MSAAPPTPRGLALRLALAATVLLPLATGSVALHSPRPAAAPAALPVVPARAAHPDSLGEPLLRLVMPVAGVLPDALRDTFDDARSGGRRHRAIDIMAPRGTPVRAAVDGYVGRLQESRLGGIAVYQLGPRGRYVYYYAHLDGYAPGLREGQRVHQGDTLGFVGTTGNAPPGTPHLHFAVWEAPEGGGLWGGEAVNPYPLLLEAAPVVPRVPLAAVPPRPPRAVAAS